MFFIAFQLTWAIIFAVSGLYWNALAATFVACCVIYLALFYDDNFVKTRFALARDKLLSSAQCAWRNVLKRYQSYVRGLGVVTLLLVLLIIIGQFFKFMLGNAFLTGLAPLFYVDMEQNIPTYFSVLLILLAALLLAVIALLNRKQRIPHKSKWVILSIGFLVMAMDEAFQFHEQLNIPVGRLLGDGSLGIFYSPLGHSWHCTGFLLGLFYLRFFLDLPAPTRFRILTAAILTLMELLASSSLGATMLNYMVMRIGRIA